MLCTPFMCCLRFFVNVEAWPLRSRLSTRNCYLHLSLRTLSKICVSSIFVWQWIGFGRAARNLRSDLFPRNSSIHAIENSYFILYVINICCAWQYVRFSRAARNSWRCAENFAQWAICMMADHSFVKISDGELHYSVWWTIWRPLDDIIRYANQTVQRSECSGWQNPSNWHQTSTSLSSEAFS